MASDFEMPVGGLITVTTYVSGTVAASPVVTATLKHNGTTIATLTNPSHAAGVNTWNGALGSDVTVNAGEQFILEIASAETDPFQIRYDSSSYPSRVELPTTTVISVDSLAVYDDSYANGGGNPIGDGFNGQTVYVPLFKFLEV